MALLHLQSLLVKMPKRATLPFISLTPLDNATANRNCPIFVASAKEVKSRNATVAVLGTFLVAMSQALLTLAKFC